MIEIDINKKLHGSSKDMTLDINLSIKEGEFLALSGQSGSGKTTLLRVLAGLEEARGVIKVGGKTWLDDKTYLTPQKRDIGFVFQEYALFSNMSVEKNLLYVKNDKKLSCKLLDITGLSELKKRLPATLSGGQKQRVALCRAMMNNPKLLLVDEPLSALDENMRVKLQQQILLFHKEFQTTTIFVSHQPSEIYTLANRVVILNDGKIINDGTPKDVLLKTKGSQKFSFEGEILEIVKVDVIYVAIVSIAQQLVEVVVSEDESKKLKVGQRVQVSTKAFSPMITAID
jgi:molybdate transport system ATP-binding protein